MVSDPLDMARPPWQVHLIENYGTGCVLLFRLHHCLADGMALMQVLRSITERKPGTARTVTSLGRRPGEDESRRRVMVNPLKATVQSLLDGTETWLKKGIEILYHPSRGLDLAGAASDVAITLGRLLLMEPDPPTLFKGPVGIPKRVAWSAPLRVKHVKTIGHVLGGSVNEVLLTAVSGALGRYLQHRGQPLSNINVRVSIPVSLRHGESAKALGNRFSLTFLALPLDLVDPVERLVELRQRLKVLKESWEAAVMFALMSAYGMAPEEIGNPVIHRLVNKITAILSSIPGPARTIYFADKPIQRVMGWVPQTGGLGLALSLVTYAGSVTLGVITDAGLVPDPISIVQGFQEELEELAKALPPLAPALHPG